MGAVLMSSTRSMMHQSEKKEAALAGPSEKSPLTTIIVKITSAHKDKCKTASDSIHGRLLDTLGNRGEIFLSKVHYHPNRRTRLTTRKTPCGQGTETWYHYTLTKYTHSMILRAPQSSLAQMPKLPIPDGVVIDVTFKTEN